MFNFSLKNNYNNNLFFSNEVMNMKKIYSSSKTIENYFSEIFGELFLDSTDVVIQFAGIKSTDTIFLDISISYTCRREVFENKYENYVKVFIQKQLEYQAKYTQKNFFSTDKVVLLRQEVVGQVDKLPPQIYYLLYRKY